jgi:methylated-DNA-protein-cysteine methyltransferase-like protein
MAEPRGSDGGFARAVYRLVRRVPRGCVVTYGQLAAWLGTPRGARAVGQALRRCPPDVPWQRVVNGQGGLSPRRDPEGLWRQRLMLEAEGVRFVRGRIDLVRHRMGLGRPHGRPRATPGRS